MGLFSSNTEIYKVDHKSPHNFTPPRQLLLTDILNLHAHFLKTQTKSKIKNVILHFQPFASCFFPLNNIL